MRNKNLVCLGRLKKSEGRKKDGLILGESERTKRAKRLWTLWWPWDLGKKIPVPNSKMGVTLRL